VEVHLHKFLTLALNGSGQLHAPNWLDSSAHWTGSWVGSRAGLDVVVN